MSPLTVIPTIKIKCRHLYRYCTRDVWSDTRPRFTVRLIKTANLAINSFLDRNVQQRASALTYSTILAMVPALAMVFAIARGFGFQNILQSEIFKYFPSQSVAIEKVITFVDSYLQHSSEGLFVGIGLLVLLWTVINLMNSVEDAFNSLWGVRQGRSIYRKATDYTAICLIIPILIVCESGITIMMATMTSQSPLSEYLNKAFDYVPILLTWGIFAAAFSLIPYTKVKFKYALIAGVISGTAFQILQWLFVSGQMYVSKYNAIYGSFAFIPLLLIWLQLTWVITLTGVMLSYAAQNVFSFNYQTQVAKISPRYFRSIVVIIMAVIVQRFVRGEKPLSTFQLATTCDLPHILVSKAAESLYDNGFITIIDEHQEGVQYYQPAYDISKITIGDILAKTETLGENGFIPTFDAHYSNALAQIERYLSKSIDNDNNTLLKDLYIG